MAEGGGEFGYDDPKLDRANHKDDGWNDEWNDDQDNVNMTRRFFREHLQLPIMVERKSKCNRCSTSRAGCRLMMMKEPLF